MDDFQDFEPAPYIDTEEILNSATDLVSSTIDGMASDLLRTRAPYDELPNDFPKDADWVRLSFVLPDDGTGNLPLDSQDISNRHYSSASLKYTDTSIGGNVCINPPPQFTRYADIRDRGLRTGSRDTTLGFANADLGMGRYYSEAIDDNNQIIHLRFGRPQYNSLTQFFTGFYSSKAASTARAGRFDDGFINKILRTTGTVIGLAVAPLFIIPMAVLMIGTAVRFFMNWPSSKFYTLRPTMPLYWSAVQGLVNQIGVNQGLVYPQDSEIMKKVLDGETLGDATKELGLFSQALPDEFNDNGTINVYAIANKSKRLQMDFENNLKDAIENSSDVEDGSYNETIRRLLSDNSLLMKKNYNKQPDRFSLESYLKRYFDKIPSLSKILNGEDNPSTEADLRTRNIDITGYKEKITKNNDGTETKEKIPIYDNSEYSPKKQDAGFFDYFIANASDGSEWASFRVDYTGTVSESFSNAVTESSLASKFNSASKTARDVRHSFADGNIDSFGIIKDVKDMISNVLSSAASVLHVEGLFAIAGNAFIDIPKAWESSSANLPKSNYTMTLISPYGNPISQMFNIYLPLSMILAGALPLSTGKQSYTSPFLCEVHDRGRLMTRLGIIDSLTITRGTSNLGFNNQGKVMAIDVSFSVLDLSSIMSMPIRPEFSLMPLDGLFDSENAFSDYLMAISGMSLGDTVYSMPILKRQLKRIKADFSTYFSAAHFGSWAAGLPGTSLINAIARGTDRS